MESFNGLWIYKYNIGDINFEATIISDLKSKNTTV